MESWMPTHQSGNRATRTCGFDKPLRPRHAKLMNDSQTPREIPDDEMLTIEQVATVLAVSVDTVRRHVLQDLPFYNLHAAGVRYRYDDVRAWAEHHPKTGNADDGSAKA